MSETSKITAARPDGQALSKLPFFGPPPLLQGEDPARYNDLLAQVSGHLKPRDLFEEIWTREITDLIWEGLRWRRDLVSFLETQLPKVLEQVLQPALEHEAETTPAPGKSFTARIAAAVQRMTGEPELLRRWFQGDAKALERVNGLLATTGLTMDHVRAQVSIQQLDKIERVNRLIANTEVRRARLLRELDWHRTDFARNARDQVEQIEQTAVPVGELAEPGPLDNEAVAPEPFPVAGPLTAQDGVDVDDVVDVDDIAAANAVTMDDNIDDSSEVSNANDAADSAAIADPPSGPIGTTFLPGPDQAHPGATGSTAPSVY